MAMLSVLIFIFDLRKLDEYVAKFFASPIHQMTNQFVNISILKQLYWDWFIHGNMVKV